VDARCARRPQTSAPHRHTNRRHRAPPAASQRSGVRDEDNNRFSKGAFGQAGARLWSAEKRRARGRARSAHRHLTRRVCLTGESAANAGSSATWPRDRASEGSRSEAKTAPAKRGSLPGRALAAPTCASSRLPADRHEPLAGLVRSDGIAQAAAPGQDPASCTREPARDALAGVPFTLRACRISGLFPARAACKTRNSLVLSTDRAVEFVLRCLHAIASPSRHPP
jgi:hypothetical protein